MPEIYPGWELWVYTDIELKPLPDYVRVLQRQAAEGSTGMFWRFEATAAPDADYVIFRDADSRLNVREKAAVDAWIKSGKSLHIMRDHDHHRCWPMLGGMWGIRGGVFDDICWDIDNWPRQHVKLDDMFFLADKVLPKFKDDCLQHGYGGEPFPPHPEYKGFVGEIVRPIKGRE